VSLKHLFLVMADGRRCGHGAGASFVFRRFDGNKPMRIEERSRRLSDQSASYFYNRREKMTGGM